MSGVAFFIESGDDRWSQFARLTCDGQEIGNSGRQDAERVWTLHGDDRHINHLVEFEQPGRLPDSFTFHGDDTLDGGTQKDVLAGGRNVFGYNTGDRYDRIVYFQHGMDVIDLSGTDFDSFEQLEDAIQTIGTSFAKIHIGPYQAILVQENRLNLSSDNFLF